MSARRPLYLKRQEQQVREVNLRRVREWMHMYDIHSLAEASVVLSDSNESSQRRVAAADILGIRWREQSFPKLFEALTADDETLVWGIANTFGSLRSKKPTRQLLRIVAVREPSARRKAAIYALGLIKDQRAVQTLVRVLSNRAEDEDTRVIAADSLGSLSGNKEARKALMLHHDDLSDRVRFTVLNALVGLKRFPELRNILRLHVNDEGCYPGRPSIAALIRSSVSIT